MSSLPAKLSKLVPDIAVIIYERHKAPGDPHWWALPAFLRDRWLETGEAIVADVSGLSTMPSVDDMNYRIEDLKMEAQRLRHDADTLKDELKDLSK